jgi:hypothetical protein
MMTKTKKKVAMIIGMICWDGNRDDMLPKNKGLKVSPGLMKIIQDTHGESAKLDVSEAVTVIHTKSRRALDSYLHCVCLRMNI